MDDRNESKWRPECDRCGDRGWYPEVDDVGDERERCNSPDPQLAARASSLLLDAAARRFASCAHEEAVIPPGKYLPVCLSCGLRIIECSRCDDKTYARHDISTSGWMKHGHRLGDLMSESTTCPRCS